MGVTPTGCVCPGKKGNTRAGSTHWIDVAYLYPLGRPWARLYDGCEELARGQAAGMEGAWGMATMHHVCLDGSWGGFSSLLSRSLFFLLCVEVSLSHSVSTRLGRDDGCESSSG